MNKARGCFIVLLVFFLITVVIYIFFSGGGQEIAQNDGQELLYSQKGANALLFLGIDERDPDGEFRGRTDTIIIYHFGRLGRSDTLIAIPRDTRVNLEGHGYNKINAAYVFGGEEMIKNEIYKLTDIKINNVMVINFAGFEKIIDALGGVEIVVEEPLHDPLSGANFDPGTYLMNGQQALAFARTRSTRMGDLDRVVRQQYLLSQLLKQNTNLSTIFKMGQVIPVLNTETKSDFSSWDYARLGFQLAVSRSDLNFITIPVVPANIDGISYLIADEQEVKEFLRQNLN